MGRMFTEQLTQGQSLALFANGTTTLNSTNVSTGSMNMGAGPKRVRAIFVFSSFTAGALLTLSIKGSNANNGTFNDITGQGVPTTKPKLTGVTPVAGELVTIEIRADQLDSGTSWVQAFAAETSGNNAAVDCVLVGDCGEYSPNNQFDNVTYVTGGSVVAA